MLFHCTVSKISHKTELLYMRVLNTTINTFQPSCEHSQGEDLWMYYVIT